MTFKQLEIFLAVAKAGNITHAAKILHLTQSACSMALSTLENQLGGILFNRHGKKLILNERGRAFFPKAANIISQMKELCDLMQEKNKKTITGHLIVGASTTIGNYLLPKVIGDFITTYPQTKISLSVSNTAEIVKKLLKFEIDIGIIEGNYPSNEIESFTWKKDELIIITSSASILAKKRNLTLHMLHNAKWILRESGSGTREKFEEAIGKKIIPFLELGNTEAIKQAVLNGLGVSCLSKTAVADLLKSKQLVELKTPFLKLKRDFTIILNKEKYKTAILDNFIEKCKKSG